MRYIDRVGKVFGRLIALRRVANNRHGNTMWLCRCTCGQEKAICGQDLRSGHIQSCGCLRIETTQERSITHGHTRGRKWTKLYLVWVAIKARVTNPKSKDWKDYGGRGITMYGEWFNDFQVFETYVLGAIGPHPGKGYSIDRIRNDGNYEPGNLRWANASEQALNRRKRAA